MTTLFTLAGFMGPDDYVQNQLPGIVDAGAWIVPVRYNNWDALGGHRNGAARLDATLTTHFANSADPAIVLGHSFGAVSICQWVKERAARSAFDPALLQFVLTGNSVTSGTGGFRWLYGDMPASSRYRMRNVVRQWDLWADQPNVAGPAWLPAFNNIQLGDASPWHLHLDYSMRLDDPHEERTVGNITYLTFPTDPIPMAATAVGPMRDAIAAQLDLAYRRPSRP